MGHIALYREWRPKTFDEIVEQSHTVAALRQAVISGSIAHAYLFSGTRGTGKTTMAQVFSRAINCLSPVNGNPCNRCAVCTGIQNGTVLDVIEMDAASNNSVDNIRRLCDEIVFAPSVAKYKVYIIDEVHMLSTGAFNALLKTLEEPPAHAVFILATTEQYRIPATILSRCQRYEFRRIPVSSIAERLRKIAGADGVEISDDALKTIAQIADGALRDAISLLDQAKGSFQGAISKEQILSLVGVVNDDFLNQMALAVVNRDPDLAMRLVEELILDGRDVVRFTTDLAAYFRNVMICKVTKKPEELVYSAAKTIAGMKTIAAAVPLDSILFLIRQLSALLSDLRWSQNARITFEIALIRLMDSPEWNSPGKIKPENKEKTPAEAPAEISSADTALVPNTPEPEPVLETVLEPVLEPVLESERRIPEASSPLPAFEAASSLPGEPLPFPGETTGSPLEEEPAPFKIPDSAVPSSETAEPLISTLEEPSPAPFSSAPSAAAPDINVLWPDLLDQIISAGQMTVYLFLLPARPVVEKQTLTVLFDDKDSLNYAELSEKQNIQVISQALAKTSGAALTIRLAMQKEAQTEKERLQQNLADDAARTADSPSTKSQPLETLKKSAEELGISFYMEE